MLLLMFVTILEFQDVGLSDDCFWSFSLDGKKFYTDLKVDILQFMV